MKSYRKGFRVERELAELFLQRGFAVVRAAGSGYFTPDILVFKRGKQFAFEVKAREGEKLYVRKEQMERLKEWEEKTAIPVYIAWRKARREFLFIPIHYLKEGKGSFSLSYEEIVEMGKRLEDIVYGI